jgi:type I restriction enzyme R subunit
MRETRMAVVISEEQGEVDKFRQWDVDIVPHRKLLKEGFVGKDGKRINVEDAFKSETHPFRIAIVCAMWMTGFDVPSLATLYLDKPLKAHTLMQAIARANRVHEGKNNGLIVDYCGILKNLRMALSTFAGSTGGESDGEIDPVRPEEELLEDLAEAISLVRGLLSEKGADLGAVVRSAGFERIAAIDKAKETANENDETRKRFEIMARAVLSKFKACLTMPGVNAFRAESGAVNIIYKRLQEDRDAADISSIMRQLHAIIEPAIAVKPDRANDGRIYDISAIDFDRLRREFKKSPKKKTDVQNLKNAIEKRLARMLAENPLRTNYQQHFEEIVAAYNGEKDRVTIETTFEAVIKLVGELDDESTRAMREGLDEETLALFDLLRKPDLSKREIDRIKKVAVDLLAVLKGTKQRIDDWRAKEQTRDEMRQAIHDFLYSDRTGLPDSYGEDEICAKAESVFAHVYRGYP